MRICPNCKAINSFELKNDGYEDYNTCHHCSRQYSLDGQPLQMTPKELWERKGIKFQNNNAA